MSAGAALLPAGLAQDVEDAIAASEPAWTELVNANREVGSTAQHSLAVKYVPSRYAATYQAPNAGLFIGSSNFTWGRGVYVTGVEEPLSTAIYGRVGVVGRFDPAGWRAFDARNTANQQLYLNWLHVQVDYPEAVLTVHSDHWLHEFRNLFREQFHIDVVMFRPDETDVSGWYTRTSDTWLAVSDWDGAGRLTTGYSTRFLDVRLTILIEEEFTADDPALTRSPQFTISRAATTPPNLPGDARAAYASARIVRVES